MKIRAYNAEYGIKNYEVTHKEKRAEKPTENNEDRLIFEYERYLIRNEKSRNTIEKYIFEAKRLMEYTGREKPTGEQLAAYKEELKERYASSSVNTKINATNSWLRFVGRGEKALSTCRIQRRIFLDEDSLLNKNDYRRLVETARNTGKERTALAIMTIGMTGIRIGELQYITAEAVEHGFARINFKAKERVILIPERLRAELKSYCRKHDIKGGSIFITRNGRPVNRKNIWAEMKSLCIKAGVMPEKAYPHNLRHLFARTFYKLTKDLINLADILGHSSIEVTRIYTTDGIQEWKRNLN